MLVHAAVVKPLFNAPLLCTSLATYGCHYGPPPILTGQYLDTNGVLAYRAESDTPLS